MKRFSTVTLGTNIFIGFLLVLALLVSVSAIGYVSQRNVVSQAEAVNGINQLVVDILKARQLEKTFALTGDEATADAVIAIIRAIQTQVEALDSSEMNDRNREVLDAIQKTASRYESAFQSYVRLAQERRQTMDEMQGKAAVALEEAQGVSDAQKSILTRARESALDTVLEKIEIADEVNVLIRKQTTPKWRLFAPSAFSESPKSIN
jgi:hypothetical protein